jgi:hypothetical protein
VRVSHLAMHLEGHLAELDINPLMVLPSGEGGRHPRRGSRHIKSLLIDVRWKGPISHSLTSLRSAPMPDLHPNANKRVDEDEITPPYNRVEAIAEIKDALSCPLSWSEVFKIDADASFEPLDLLWKQTLEAHVKGSEGEYSGFMLSLN